MVYRSKWKIALELVDRAVANGVVFEWLTFDEGYGGKPLFLQGLEGRKQRFVAEVPTTFSCWTQRPRVTERPFRRGGRGRPRKVPRLVAAASAPQSVKELAENWSVLRDQEWTRYYVKDGEKGPLVREAKHARVVMKNDDGLPGVELQLVVARNVLHHDEVKYFVSNAPAETPVQTLLLVAFSRWRVERCFRDQKQEIGLDQWEGRCYHGLKRHLILSCVSYLFLTRCRQRLRGGNPEVTVCQVHAAVAALLPSWWRNGRASPTLIEHTAHVIQHWQQRNAEARKSHRKRTLKKLRKIGIALKYLIRCRWT